VTNVIFQKCMGIRFDKFDRFFYIAAIISVRECIFLGMQTIFA